MRFVLHSANAAECSASHTPASGVIAIPLITDERKIFEMGIAVVDEVVEHHQLEEPLDLHRISGDVLANEAADLFVGIIRICSFPVSF